MKDYVKRAIRNSCRKARSRLSSAYQRNASGQICRAILKLPQYHSARHIGLYYASQGEVDLSEVWRVATRQGKLCYFPLLNKDRTLTFLPVTSGTTFKMNQWGILEPQVDIAKALPVSSLELLLMPLVAFDKKGTRIGMGKGCYDRTLSKKSSLILMGVAYDFQLKPYLYPQAWDIPLTVTITPKRVYWSKS